MAMTRNQVNKAQRDKYKKDRKYREYKKEYRSEYEKNHKKHENKMSREYYGNHPEYRKKKIKQAKLYQKKKKAK